MVQNDIYTLGIDIGSTTVKIAVLDQDNEVLFSDCLLYTSICEIRSIR